MTKPARVLVVDDSAFARKVLRESLNDSPLVEVVGIAHDGLEALEKIIELQPDVVTLDLMMPNLDGLGVLRELLKSGARPRVVLVCSSGADSQIVVEALRLGAFDIVQKPTSLATEVLYELADELVQKVVAASQSLEPRSAPATPPPRRAASTADVQLVVIGTSTGGPNALTRVLTKLPADFPVPVVIALHIPADYTLALAQRLDEDCAVDVVEAGVETVLRPGLVVLAKGGLHLRVARDGIELIARPTKQPRDAPFVPSVDVLFASAAAATGKGTLGCVLTGMGNDGLRGARDIVEAGGSVITEAEESCIVYGMPRCLEDAGLSSAVLSLDRIAEELVRRARPKGGQR